MKKYWQSFILGLITLLVMLFVLLVDTAFYRFPTIIKMFTYERELLIALAFICLFLSLRASWRGLRLSPAQHLWLHNLGILLAVVGLLFWHGCFRKYLVLWDDNPFLAEYPFVWNLFSMLVTFSFMAILFLLILNIDSLMKLRGGRHSRWGMRFLVGLFLAFAVGLNFFESRYAFQAIEIINPHLRIYWWLLTPLVGIVFVLNTLNLGWLDYLDRREKYIAAALGLITLGLGSLLYFSHLLHPLYAYSVVIKGFVIVALAFVLFYTLISWCALLLRLPGAKYYERMQLQASHLNYLNRLVYTPCSQEQKLNVMLKCCQEATRAEGSWLQIEDATCPAVDFFLFSPEFDAESKEELKSLDLRKHLPFDEQYLTIDDLMKDERTPAFRLLQMPWRSLMVVKLHTSLGVPGILGLVKKKSYGFEMSDWQTLEPILIKAAAIWAKSHYEPNRNSVYPSGQTNPAVVNYGSFQVFHFQAAKPSLLEYWEMSCGRALLLWLVFEDEKVFKDFARLELRGAFKYLLQTESQSDTIITKGQALLQEYLNHSASVSVRWLFLNAKDGAVTFSGEAAVAHGSIEASLTVENLAIEPPQTIALELKKDEFILAFHRQPPANLLAKINCGLQNKNALLSTLQGILVQVDSLLIKRN